MEQIELSATTVEYTDTGGYGPVLALPHRLMTDAVGRADRRPVELMRNYY